MRQELALARGSVEGRQRYSHEIPRITLMKPPAREVKALGTSDPFMHNSWGAGSAALSEMIRGTPVPNLRARIA